MLGTLSWHGCQHEVVPDILLGAQPCNMGVVFTKYCRSHSNTSGLCNTGYFEMNM